MKVVKFFMKLLSCLFILVFTLVCLITTVFLMTKNMVSYDSINSYVNSANVFDYKAEETGNNSSTIRQQIEKEMLDMDVPALVTDSVLDSSEIRDIISKYIYNYSHYVFLDQYKPVFPTSKILSLVEDKYATLQGKTLSQNQRVNITKYINSLGEKIDKTLFDTGELNEVVSLDAIKTGAVALNSVYILYALVIAIVVLFIIICLCLGSIKKAINWCGKAILLDGFLLIILSFVEVKLLIAYFNSQGLLDNLAILVVEKGFQNLLIYGGILITIGVLFIIISAVLLRKEKKNKSNDMLERVIKEEVEKSKTDIESEKIVNKKEEKDNPEEVLPKANNKEKQKQVKDKEKINDEIKTGEQAEKKENNIPLKEEEKINIDKKESEPVSEKIQEDKNVENDDQNNKSIEVKEEKMEIVPVPEENGKHDVKKNENEEVGYKELNDEQVQEEPIHVEKKELEIKPLEAVQVEVVHPIKGDAINLASNDNIEDEDEDIEIL